MNGGEERLIVASTTGTSDFICRQALAEAGPYRAPAVPLLQARAAFSGIRPICPRGELSVKAPPPEDRRWLSPKEET